MNSSILMPSLLLAGGVIASTGVASIASEAGWLVLGGPLVMALTLLGVSLPGQKSRPEWRRTFRVALILGAALLVGGAIVAFANPGYSASVMPVLGGGAAVALLARLRDGLSARQDFAPPQSTRRSRS